MSDQPASLSDLLAVARSMLSSDSMELVGRRTKSAALLVRGSLEAAVAGFWEANEPSIGRAPMRTQMLCLSDYASPTVAGHAAYLFAVLSRACHYHPYELAPTTAELLAAIEGVEGVVTALTTIDHELRVDLRGRIT